jgi:hypothetical protein
MPKMNENPELELRLEKLVERKQKPLKWLPWVGLNYTQQKTHRLLIVGESHYYTNLVDDCANKDFTREIVDTGKEKLHQNIQEFLSQFINDGQIIWENIAFYNFVQESVKKKVRPSYLQYCGGIDSFNDLCRELLPTHCLFCGVSSAHILNEHLMESETNWRMQSHGKIDNCFPRTASFNSGDKKTKAIFIRHPSSYFSPEKWRNFIVQQWGYSAVNLLCSA